MPILRYLAHLSPSRRVLWCYLIWYLTMLAYHFEPAPKLWINSLGISALIGSGLLLSVAAPVRLRSWQTFRLYLMPFCVSSFAALITDRGFILVLSPAWRENATAIGACLAFVMLSLWLGRGAQRAAGSS